MNGWLKKRRVMRRYDLTAGMYDRRYAEEQAAKIEAALKNMKVQSGDLILDVGCGTGVLFDYVAAEANGIVGVDFSRKTLLEARRHMSSKNFHNIHLVQAEADNMPFRSNVFNSVFAITILQNSPNPIATLTETRRIAKDDAIFAITGLKKIFAKRSFQQLMSKARLNVIAMENDQLKCHVAVCTK